MSFQAKRGILAGADISGTLEDFSPRSLVSLAYLVEINVINLSGFLALLVPMRRMGTHSGLRRRQL